MQANQLRPASFFAGQFGVKSLVFGGPGTGKTPIADTAPRPVLLACEPGLLSMRYSQIPTWRAETGAQIDEFFTWLMSSHEAKQFDTVAVDSTSEMAEIYLREAARKNPHGLGQYKIMAENTYKHLWNLYVMREKHAYLIAKQAVVEQGGIYVRKPYYPGNSLNVAVPHLYDEILHVARVNIPGPGEVVAFRSRPTVDILARDRSGRLDEFEPPNLTSLFSKCMS